MDIPERSIGLGRAQANWRWAANTATACILVLGLVAAALRGTGLLAAAIIVLAALVDGADGALARRAGGATRTGAILDIVGDFAAFGVAPAGLALARAPTNAWPLAAALAAALAVYLAAALARLARSARLALTKPAGLYVGLPMPTAGCLIAGLALNLPAPWAAPAIVGAVLVISALAISRRPYPSLPWLWRQRRASLLIFLAVTAAVAALSPRAALLVAAAVCAGYPWARPVRA